MPEYIVVDRQRDLMYIRKKWDRKNYRLRGIDKTIPVWDIENRQQIKILKGHTANVSSLFSTFPRLVQVNSRFR